VGLLLVGIGVGLGNWTWYSAHHQSQYSLKAAIVGPMALVLGLGMLVHGAGIPTTGATLLTRIYGFAGTVAALGLLHYLGYFNQPGHGSTERLLESGPLLLLLFIWFLPSRFFGPRAARPSAPPSTSADARPDPIVPR
jgi:hypothetical protein